MIGAPPLAEIRALLAPHRIEHVGVASAEILDDARTALHERKAAGLHDGMQFTYRNPDRSTDPRRAVEGARSIIVGARSYLTDDEPAVPADGVHARVGRYAWADQYEPLRIGLRVVADRLRDAGHRAAVFADDNSIVDRAVAHRAGLGWFGKNANLLLPGAGSFFTLGCIITTAEYRPAERPANDGCGSCRQCIDDCPTDAIVAPGVIDAGRCLSWILQKAGSIPLEFRTAIHDRIYGCDDCQDGCPITVRLGARHTVPLGVADDVQRHVDVIELLALDDDDVERRHGRWYIAGREMRWLRRNALVVIGNTGDPNDPGVRAVVEGYRADPDAILAEHADWAARRLDERRGEPTPQDR
ncbi:MAG: tRNA epoxyqueuosine(34) reductase QueG [Ilumatobacter sp.]